MSQSLQATAFQSAAQIQADLAQLSYMLGVLRGALAQSPVPAPKPEPAHFSLSEPDGRVHRIIVAPLALRAAGGRISVTGFFAHRRPGADALLAEADAGLVSDLFTFPYLISYSTLQLPDGEYANMVLLSEDEGRAAWNGSPRHARAARDLAPQAYYHVRIHLAALAQGLLVGDPVIERTKYFDYQTSLAQAG